jgi:hypothetical protein
MIYYALPELQSPAKRFIESYHPPPAPSGDDSSFATGPEASIEQLRETLSEVTDFVIPQLDCSVRRLWRWPMP